MTQLELYLEWIRLIENKLDSVIENRREEDTSLTAAASFIHLAYEQLEDYINGK